MNNKRWLILIFILFAEISYVFPQIYDSDYDSDYDSVSAVDTIERGNSILNLKQRKKEYLNDLRSVSRDTVSQKVAYFTPHFQDKYKDDPDFDYSRTIGGKSFWEKLQEMIKNLFSVLFGWDKNHDIGKATDIAFKIISGIIVLIVLYVLVRVIMKHEGKWFFQRKNEDIDIDENDLEELILYADFEHMIVETESKKDTRQSIRLYYLWLLRTLKEKKIIDWNAQKTNADYQNEIKDEVAKEKFTYLSYLYNYIWYGEFSINDEEYKNAKNAFLTYLKRNGNNG